MLKNNWNLAHTSLKSRRKRCFHNWLNLWKARLRCSNQQKESNFAQSSSSEELYPSRQSEIHRECAVLTSTKKNNCRGRPGRIMLASRALLSSRKTTMTLILIKYTRPSRRCEGTLGSQSMTISTVDSKGSSESSISEKMTALPKSGLWAQDSASAS